MSKVHADCVEEIVGDTILFLYNSNENLAVFLIGRNWIHKTYNNKVEGWKWNFTVRLLWCGNIPLHFKWEVFFFFGWWNRNILFNLNQTSFCVWIMYNMWMHKTKRENNAFQLQNRLLKMWMPQTWLENRKKNDLSSCLKCAISHHIISSKFFEMFCCAQNWF